jgi:hypothetical protein
MVEPDGRRTVKELVKLLESLYIPPYTLVEPLIPIAEKPLSVVLRSRVYSTKRGSVEVVVLMKTPAEYDRPVVPVLCVASVVPHVTSVSEAVTGIV